MAGGPPAPHAARRRAHSRLGQGAGQAAGACCWLVGSVHAGGMFCANLAVLIRKCAATDLHTGPNNLEYTCLLVCACVLRGHASSGGDPCMTNLPSRCCVWHRMRSRCGCWRRRSASVVVVAQPSAAAALQQTLPQQQQRRHQGPVRLQQLQGGRRRRQVANDGASTRKPKLVRSPAWTSTR